MAERAEKTTRKVTKGTRGMPVALGGDEGRDKLRKAPVSGKCAPTRRCPNGETRRERSRHPRVARRRTRGTETSKYPQEEKITMIAQVVASERARAQTAGVKAPSGL